MARKQKATGSKVPPGRKLGTDLPKRQQNNREGVTMVSFTFRARADQLVALRQIQTEVGIPVTEQLRRAIDRWLAKGGR